MATKEALSKKRQQIAKANRNVFAIVALASLVVGFCAVSSFFLVQRIAFRTTVVGAANETLRTLESNLENVGRLEGRINGLAHNNDLMSVAQGEDMNALRSIADALPIIDNPAALGASLSDKIFSIPEVRLDSLRISTSNIISTTSGAGGTTTDPHVTNFDFRITSASTGDGREQDILVALRNVERSIRAIHIETFRLSYSSRLELFARATAYHVDPINTALGTRVMTPDSNSATTTGGSR